MKRLVICMAMLLAIAVVSHAETVVNFTLTWEPVTSDINGNPATPDGYRVYACNQPIVASFADPISEKDVVDSSCGDLQVFEIMHDDFVAAQIFSGDYLSQSDAGAVYFRVSAYVDSMVNGEPKVIESGLSNEVSGEFKGPLVFGPINTLKLSGSGLRVIQP